LQERKNINFSNYYTFFSFTQSFTFVFCCCLFQKQPAKSMKNAAAFYQKESKKPQPANSRCTEMIQNPEISTKKHSLRSTCKIRLFVAIPIIKTTPDSVERRSGFVQRSFHRALRSAMCATKTYMLHAVYFLLILIFFITFTSCLRKKIFFLFDNKKSCIFAVEKNQDKMEQEKRKITSELVDNESVFINKATMQSVDFYAKTMEIIERTQFAMGRKKPICYATSSTLNEKLNTNVFATTH